MLSIFRVSLSDRRDDQLAALEVWHAPRLQIGIELPPALDAHAMAQAAGRVIHAAMDDLGIARGRACADPVRRLEHDHIMPRARELGAAIARPTAPAPTNDKDVDVH
jgi:hypothetical protein